MIKYILFPGPVISKYDGDLHYITASQLCELYNVNPMECITYNSDTMNKKEIIKSGLKQLYPKYNGNYK